jgi:hypothetical protein
LQLGTRSPMREREAEMVGGHCVDLRVGAGRFVAVRSDQTVSPR